MSAAGTRHLALLHTLPCVVCLFCYDQRVLAEEAHHLEVVRGEHSTFATIPLCRQCHLELHESRRRAFYLAHKLSDVKLMAWGVQLIEEALTNGR